MCVNEPGTFRCECPSGYKLDSDGKTCLDVNECNEQDPCKNGEYCQNTKGR